MTRYEESLLFSSSNHFFRRFSHWGKCWMSRRRERKVRKRNCETFLSKENVNWKCKKFIDIRFFALYVVSGKLKGCEKKKGKNFPFPWYTKKITHNHKIDLRFSHCIEGFPQLLGWWKIFTRLKSTQIFTHHCIIIS